MAYGRLDVFWPDGLLKTFPLVENSISVGRSSGNTIVLDTSMISRYHFSITHDGQNVFITDLESANGTFVDGKKLPTNQSQPLYGGEEIQVGDLHMIYNHLDEMPTQPMASLEETTQRIELQLPDFRLDVIGPEFPVSPGAHTSAEVGITNTSAETQIYTIEVTGLPPEWVRIDRLQFSVEPNEIGQASITIKPLRRSESKPGDYPVTVRVALKDQPETHLEAHLVARILPYSGFGLALESNWLSSGDRFRLHLHNQGSAPLSLTILGRSPGDRLRFNIFTPQVTLTPGQRFTVQGDIHSRNPPLFGKPQQVSFDLLVRSKDASQFLAVVRGQFLERARLPSWLPMILLVFVLVGAGLLGLGLAALLQPAREPRLVSFQVNSTQVAQGSSLSLSWSATDAQQISVLVNGTPALTGVGAQTSGVQLNTSDLAGNVVISLLAANGDRTSTVSQEIYVYRPLSEGFFTTTPAQLVRYIVEDLTVGWNIPGAVTTRLTGLETFSTMPLEAAYGPEQTISGIVGIAYEPFTLRLYAEDEVGNTREQTLEIQVVDPRCAPRQGAVTLYAGPDQRHQVVGTVQPGTFVVVDAQDTSGQWLRVQVTGVASAWGQRAEFDCGQAFDPGNLYKELNVPTVPPPTLTPSHTATPSPTASPTLRPSLTPRPTLTPTVTRTPLG